MVNTACLVAQVFVAEEGRLQGHRNSRTLTKERNPTKERVSNKRQPTKEQAKLNQKS